MSRRCSSTTTCSTSSGLLRAEKGITTGASVTNGDAPDIYLTGNPVPTDPTLQAFEQALYSHLRVVLLYVNIVSYGTQEILAETA